MNYNTSILYIILISTFIEVNASLDWNIENLLQQYFTLCGPSHFCFLHEFAFQWTTQDSNIENKCPPCSCETKCLLDRNCCPDLYFSHPELTCTSVAILNGSADVDAEHISTFLIIDSCPESTDEETKRKCENVSSYIEKIFYPPVTSQNSSLAYLNRHCAKCNDEFNYYPWPLDIVCDKFLDINFFSSYEDLIEKGKENRCNIFSHPPYEENNYKCKQDKQLPVHFDSCNKTGSWETFEYNIQRGCESKYINNDKMFKNMFCKICNPPFYTDVIDRCNVTGMWDIYDATQESACLNNDMNPGSLPYKNVFCFSCNKQSRQNLNFLDVNIEMQTIILETTFYYDIRILNFKEDFFITKMNGEHSDYDKSKTSKDEAIHSPNITNLLFKRMSLEGNIRTCGNYSIPSQFSTSEKKCSCDPKCIFTDGLSGFDNCCVDVPLLYPSVCLNEKKLSGIEAQQYGEELLVTRGCPGTDHLPEFIRKGCHEQFDDAFSMHPVTDSSTDIPYLNMYCLLCSQSPSTKLVRHKPWDITANCTVYIDESNFLLFSDFLKTLRAAGCDTYYFPPTSTSCQYFKGKRCFQKSDSMINKCNITGNWLRKDPDIHWACELMPSGSLPLWRDFNNNQLTYKNVYCALCNPPAWPNISVENCSSEISTISIQKCSFFPKIYFLAPYRNIFCDFCKNEYLKTKIILNDICYGKPDYQYQIRSETFDSLLSQYFSPYKSFVKSRYLYIYPNDNFSTEATSRPQCMETQNFYSKMGGCRNITCYPGKALYLGETCKPLFREARNLQYHMDVFFNCSTQHNTSVEETLSYILYFTYNKSVTLFGTGAFRKLIIEINKPCQEEISPENHFQVHLSFTSFFKTPVPRLQTELDLLNIKYNFSIPGLNMILNVPSTESNWSTFCSSTTINEDGSDDLIKYRAVRVTNLLVCTQIELSRQEFEINKTKTNVLLKMYNITLEGDDFDILPDGTARVCVSTLRQIHNDTQGTYKIYLKKIPQDSLVFALMILSCIFLLITFCTYCIFHELRTLPGGTIMILIAVLFTTDAFILSNRGREVNTRRCVVYGIIIHYLWLVSFFSMNICSFHLYRVFHSKFPLHSQNSKWRILAKYAMYIFFAPLVVVSSNIAVMMTKHKDIGYGKVKCFINESLHLIVFFLVPVGLLCIVNLFFFTKTLSTIMRSPKIRKNKAKTNEFSIFARLFTITGATWLLQILDGFLENRSFSHVVSAINSLHGVFIFIAFMCSKRTLKLYQRLILRRCRNESSATSVTCSTEKTSFKSVTSE